LALQIGPAISLEEADRLFIENVDFQLVWDKNYDNKIETITLSITLVIDILGQLSGILTQQLARLMSVMFNFFQ